MADVNAVEIPDRHGTGRIGTPPVGRREEQRRRKWKRGGRHGSTK
ncbi:MAG: hypothetical protein ACKOOF_09370 [Planctomycetaceae bacterium]